MTYIRSRHRYADCIHPNSRFKRNIQRRELVKFDKEFAGRPIIRSYAELFHTGLMVLHLDRD
jgi:hypothetical protein